VCYDDVKKRKYYYHEKTKESRWTLPEELKGVPEVVVRKPPSAAASTADVDFSDDEEYDLPA
jgi:hypothetical protein